MKIVELSDYSMVIMKDSQDPPWVSVGNVYRAAVKHHDSIIVDVEQVTVNYIKTSDYVYTAGRLVLFFKDKIPSSFHLQDKVVLEVY